MLLIKQSRRTCKVTILNIKRKELEPLKMFIPHEKGVAEKLKWVASKYRFIKIFTKAENLRGQLRTKQKDKMET